jgi:drug/metabolite transporter (DMT)-like permease
LAVEDLSAVVLTPLIVIMLLIVGVVHTGIAYALYFGSMNGLKAQTVALFSYIDPIVAIILSALFLKEPMTVYSVIGAVLVLGATMISELPEKQKK